MKFLIKTEEDKEYLINCETLNHCICVITGTYDICVITYDICAITYDICVITYDILIDIVSSFVYVPYMIVQQLKYSFQILNPELVKSQLQTAMKEYLVQWVHIDKNENTVCIIFQNIAKMLSVWGKKYYVNISG